MIWWKIDQVFYFHVYPPNPLLWSIIRLPIWKFWNFREKTRSWFFSTRPTISIRQVLTQGVYLIQLTAEIPLHFPAQCTTVHYPPSSLLQLEIQCMYIILADAFCNSTVHHPLQLETHYNPSIRAQSPRRQLLHASQKWNQSPAAALALALHLHLYLYLQSPAAALAPALYCTCTCIGPGWKPCFWTIAPHPCKS